MGSFFKGYKLHSKAKDICQCQRLAPLITQKAFVTLHNGSFKIKATCVPFHLFSQMQSHCTFVFEVVLAYAWLINQTVITMPLLLYNAKDARICNVISKLMFLDDHVKEMNDVHES